MPKIIVTGIPEVDRLFRAAGPKLANKMGRRTLRDGCKVFAAEAIAKAPEETGTLRANIKVRAGRRSRGKVRMAVVIGLDKYPFKKPPRRPYLPPAAVEFGHKARDGETVVKRKPFMRPAFDAKKSEVLALVRAGLAAFVRSGLKG